MQLFSEHFSQCECVNINATLRQIVLGYVIDSDASLTMSGFGPSYKFYSKLPKTLMFCFLFLNKTHRDFNQMKVSSIIY